MDTMEEDLWHGVTARTFAALADAYGTPYYLFDADAVAARVRSIRSSFQSLVRVYYAVKANPNLELLRALAGVVDGLDISSAGEMEQALLAGYTPDQLSFAGPAKTTEELTTSIVRGVGAISVESEQELRCCVRFAEELAMRAKVVLRVNPLLRSRWFGMKMGGKPVQFGIDEESMGSALQILVNHTDVLDFQGIHVYAGSQCFDAQGLAEGVKDTLRIADMIEEATDLTCRKINLGGGFGVSHGERDHELDLSAAADSLIPAMRRWHASSGMQRELIFELGRYLTAEAGIYVARVISQKESRGKQYYVLDGGLHHHLAAAGTFGAALRANFPLQNLSVPATASRVRCNIAGPSCNPTDLLGVEVELGSPTPGDLIAVRKSGSYGLSASPLLFLGRTTPAELVIRNGSIVLGRTTKSILDFN